jgi:hypothetical protein
MTAGPDAPTADRVRLFLERLDRLSVDDLSVLALAPSDPSELDRLREQAELVAEAAGRRSQLAAAVRQAHQLVVQAFSFRGLEPTWFGLNWGRALSRADDRARLLAAVEDAAMAAVVEDLLPDEAAGLADPFELAASMRGSAPTSNPASSVHRNAVRVAWVVGAFGWLAFGAQLLIDLVAEILSEESNLLR